ncbi:hypothetical protein ACI2IX_06150 [Leifsonia aquatica]|uniref:hypothetical protein n=1 Tax=Leifsonia aquatica TaxID=144185 RepID=UPI00384F2AD9
MRAVKLKRRTLSLNNVISCTLELRDGDELLGVIDGAADYFREVLVRNGYYTTSPTVFRVIPGSREFTIMTALGNRVNLVGDSTAGFEFNEHLEVETDYFYRHSDVEAPVPYDELKQSVDAAGANVLSIYHVILDLYGDVVLDLYVEADPR